MKNIFLSVIIPAYNEEENAKHGVLRELWKYLKRQPYRWEVVIVDDGSTDRTATLVTPFVKQHKGFSFLQIPHSGKAGAITAGFKKAKGEIFLFTDFDQSVPISQVEKFFPKFEHGFDLVFGSRTDRKGSPFLRRVTGYGFILLRKLLIGLPYRDTQCGFKAFRREAADRIMKRMVIFSENKKQNGYLPTAGFDLEILVTAQKLGLKIAEVPVKWVYKEKKTFNALKVSFLALKEIISVRRIMY